MLEVAPTGGGWGGRVAGDLRLRLPRSASCTQAHPGELCNVVDEADTHVSFDAGLNTRAHCFHTLPWYAHDLSGALQNDGHTGRCRFRTCRMPHTLLDHPSLDTGITYANELMQNNVSLDAASPAAFWSDLKDQNG
jgi:hypothetical protein